MSRRPRRHWDRGLPVFLGHHQTAYRQLDRLRLPVVERFGPSTSTAVNERGAQSAIRSGVGNDVATARHALADHPGVTNPAVGALVLGFYDPSASKEAVPRGAEAVLVGRLPKRLQTARQDNSLLRILFTSTSTDLGS
jgi:hypothetical protein